MSLTKHLGSKVGGGHEVNALVAWAGAIAYALQIYFDFSGYSDMALGLAQIFGFKFNENFDYPYAADSVQNFWRRWHISLSSWFKEYLYIPLGGNRKGKIRTIINKYIVFFATGLWHGANWTFVVWGLLHGTALVMEDTKLSIKRIPFKIIRQILTLVIVVTTFVLFRADTISDGVAFIGKMYSAFWMAPESTSVFLALFTPVTIVTMIIAIVLSQPVKNRVEKYLHVHTGINRLAQPISFLIAICLLMLVIMNLASNAYNPFIYFRF